MPPSPEYYINSVIYTIQHKEIPELLYVGSTSSFFIRSNIHKNNCNNPNSQQYSQKLYEIIRKNGGWTAFEMSIYKKNPCYNKDALLIAEDRVIDELKPLLNKNRAYLTVAQKKQYQIDYKKKNKEKLYKYYRLWTITNKDKIDEHKRKYKDYIKEYYRQYYILNKDHIKQKQKEYQAEIEKNRKLKKIEKRDTDLRLLTNSTKN